jgi:hypothetical protein
MQLFLTFIEDVKSIIFEVNEKGIFHLVGDLVEESSDVFMTVVVIEDPSKTLVDTNDVVMQLVSAGSIVRVKLLFNL